MYLGFPFPFPPLQIQGEKIALESYVVDRADTCDCWGLHTVMNLCADIVKYNRKEIPNFLILCVLWWKVFQNIIYLF